MIMLQISQSDQHSSITQISRSSLSDLEEEGETFIAHRNRLFSEKDRKTPQQAVFLALKLAAFLLIFYFILSIFLTDSQRTGAAGQKASKNMMDPALSTLHEKKREEKMNYYIDQTKKMQVEVEEDRRKSKQEVSEEFENFITRMKKMQKRRQEKQQRKLALEESQRKERKEIAPQVQSEKKIIQIQRVEEDIEIEKKKTEKKKSTKTKENEKEGLEHTVQEKQKENSLPSASKDQILISPDPAPKKKEEEEDQSYEKYTEPKYINLEEVEDHKGCRGSQIGMKLTDITEVTDKFIQIDEIKPFPELDICVLAVDEQGFGFSEIKSSLQEQQYSNFISIFITTNSKYIKRSGEQNPRQKIQYVPFLSYSTYRDLINKHCQKNALIFMTKNQLTPTSLIELNELHQSYNAWVSYSKIDEKYEIHSFYRRVFDLVEKNDFTKFQKNIWTRKGEERYVALAFMELCQKHKKKINKNLLFTNDGSLAPFSMDEIACFQKMRPTYQPLAGLNQGHPVSLQAIADGWKKFNENHDNHYNGFKARPEVGMSQQKGFRAIEDESLYYLPQTHSLFKRQYKYYNDLYEIQKYSSKQLPFCLTVLNHNNVQHERTFRAMTSVLAQNYSNYHIVFMDDNSDDGNLQVAKQYMLKNNFPSSRINYVRNLERKFATYNIIHGAFSYCGEDQIQMLIDGDDQFVGTLVMNVFNAIYQKDENVWVSYSSYISNFYSYGESKPCVLESKSGKRVRYHCLGPVRTWSVKLVRQIPLQYHQFLNKQWIDTMYDDALTYSLYELATKQRMLYLPEIMYYYNRFYGDNDDSSEEKVKHRKDAQIQIASYKRLPKLESLNAQLPPNTEIIDVFEKDKGKVYEDL